MPPVKDYYKVLGVAKDASAEDIKKAYRKLARKLHPDVTGGDKDKTARFKEVSEAYETVGDDKRRSEYDAMRANPFAGAGAGGGPGGQGGFAGGFPGGQYTWSTSGGGAPGGGAGIDPSVFEQFFRSRGAGGGGRGGRAPGFDFFSDLGGDAGDDGGPRRARVGADVEATLEVDLETAALGGKMTFTLGKDTLTVKIPPGIQDGATMRLAGKGEPGRGGAGDLLLRIKHKPHSLVTRQGDDLMVDLPITVEEAVLGAKVDVATLEGRASLSVPPGTSSGARLRLRGKGAFKSSKGDERGDLYARIMIQVPKSVDDEAARLLREFSKRAPVKPQRG